MKVLVVYDSTYGNTEQIARAVGGALAAPDGVKIVKAGEANLAELTSGDLLIIGSPTHGGRPTPTIVELLNKVPEGSLKDVNAATFDTRVKNVVAKIFGYAAGRIAGVLKDKGAHLVASPEGFVVEGTKGPVKSGELERASAWAKEVAASKVSS